MADLSALLGSTAPVDVIVGIPSFNNGATIAHVAKTAVRGIADYFPDRRGLILNSDGGSPDQTPRAAVDAALRARDDLEASARDRIAVSSVRYRGPSGKGSAFREIFEAAGKLGASAVVVLDADLRSVAPEWIGRLAGPIVSGEVDFVAPLYRRHKFDGTITNAIVYPLTDAVFGGGIRQPIGGDFGVSGRLAGLYASKDVWDTDVARFGIDLWMTTTALAEGFRVAQTHLGAKVHDPKDPGQHLAAMLVQVVGTAFALLETYADVWTMRVLADRAPTFGQAEPVTLDPVLVDVARMEEQFRFGVQTLDRIYGLCLPSKVWADLRASAAGDAGISDTLWAQIIIHFAIAFHRRSLARDQLVSSLTPLYLGRTATFIRRNADRSDDEAEADVQALARVFADVVRELHRLWKEES
ncbi:MAG TPA: glycosyl transferase family 2 [Thermoanaerobaculia bacterium]|nr:glycosyl transferase family 2 [Thermoanaerobaculia bacterium]